MILDRNGDPVFTYLILDPQNTNLPDQTELWFESWNRAQYQWNPSGRVAVIGDVNTRFHVPLSLAQDRSSGVWGIASEESPRGTNRILAFWSNGNTAKITSANQSDSLDMKMVYQLAAAHSARSAAATRTFRIKMIGLHDQTTEALGGSHPRSSRRMVGTTVLMRHSILPSTHRAVAQ